MTMIKERDGSNKLVLLARALVIFTQKAAGFLINKYGANSPIGILVAAIIAIGELLPAAEADALLTGGDNDPVFDDPNDIPGMSEFLPVPPPDPEEE